MAMMSGLVQYPVFRMKNTWKNLPPAILSKWEKLEKLASPIDNFRNLRGAFLGSPPPSILPMSILLRDLTFIEDGNQNWHDKEAGLINCSKVELLGRVFTQVNERQHISYPLTYVSIIQEYIKNLFYLDDLRILDAQSKVIEPSILI